MQDLASEFPRITLLETVWKVLGGRVSDLRYAPWRPWRAGDTPPICPTTNGGPSAPISPICPSTPDKDAPGYTTRGRSSMRSSTF